MSKNEEKPLVLKPNEPTPEQCQEALEMAGTLTLNSVLALVVQAARANRPDDATTKAWFERVQAEAKIIHRELVWTMSTRGLTETGEFIGVAYHLLSVSLSLMLASGLQKNPEATRQLIRNIHAQDDMEVFLKFLEKAGPLKKAGA